MAQAAIWCILAFSMSFGAPPAQAATEKKLSADPPPVTMPQAKPRAATSAANVKTDNATAVNNRPPNAATSGTNAPANAAPRAAVSDAAASGEAASASSSTSSSMSAPAENPSLTETVSVGYVMIPFTVLGGKGAPVTDLRESEVSVLVDGIAVQNDLFERSTNAPVSFTILLDGSGSMGLAGKMESARAAVGSLLAQRQTGDDFALYVFDDTAAHEIVAFTDNPSAIIRAMSNVRPFGKTAFFDALATMPERSRLGRNPTRAIILLSDGIDNASKLTRTDLAARLEGVAVPIYPLGLRDASEARLVNKDPAKVDEALSDAELLDEIAHLTGGKLYLGDRPEQLATSIANLETSLRAQYLIGFTPTGKGAVKYRHISLKLAGRVRSVRVRAGYRGTEPPVVRAASTREKSKRSERKGS